jgi:hypothetical protein
VGSESVRNSNFGSYYLGWGEHWTFPCKSRGKIRMRKEKQRLPMLNEMGASEMSELRKEISLAVMLTVVKHDTWGNLENDHIVDLAFDLTDLYIKKLQEPVK